MLLVAVAILVAIGIIGLILLLLIWEQAENIRKELTSGKKEFIRYMAAIASEQQQPSEADSQIER